MARDPDPPTDRPPAEDRTDPHRAEDAADRERDADLDAVMRATRVISGIVAESLAQAGDAVTMPQLRALVIISTRPGPTPGAIARALQIHPSNASRLCDRLVANGLVERGESAADRRHLTLSLTADGRRLLAEIMSSRRDAFARILDRIEPARRHALRRELELFAEAADEPSDAHMV